MIQLWETGHGVPLGVGALNALLALHLVSQQSVVEEPTHTGLVHCKRLGEEHIEEILGGGGGEDILRKTSGG